MTLHRIMLQKVVKSSSCLIALVSTLCLLIYWSGLTGGFLLDDNSNLNKLGEFNGVRNLDTFLMFVGNGIAGPSGRPLSLLSFLVNGTNWPTDPYPFKLTNLALHCVTGFFLYLLCRLLFLTFSLKQQQAGIAAFIATGFWLLHPFFVSTVLYVVQRMAMLSAFFSIFGLWLYSKGRFDLTENPRKSYLIMSLGLALCTVLAILSKENGVLLPISAAILELCIFSHPKAKTTALTRYWTAIFLVLPSVTVCTYLLNQINFTNFSQPFGNRNFNLPERLLTESRILIGYLYDLFIPKLSYPGLFYENIEISKGFLNPPTTIACTLLILLLISSALFLRKRFPFFALATLFFFAGHLLESTTIPLELYFEHRNYLPAIFLFVPLGYFFVTQSSQMIKGFIITLLLICSLFTYQLSSLWGNELGLHLYWAKQNPYSSRSQIAVALVLEKKGKQLEALELLSQAKTNIPDSLDLYWYWLKLKCILKGVTPEEFAEIKWASGKIPFKMHEYNMLQDTIATLLKPECKGVNSENALELLDVLLKNPTLLANQARLFQPHHLKGLVYASTKRRKEAAEEFSTALNLTQNVEHGFVQVGILGSQGYYQEALAHLNATEISLKAQPAPASNLLKTKPDYLAEISRIKSSLLDDIENSKENNK